jgi:hypothetical protein
VATTRSDKEYSKQAMNMQPDVAYARTMRSEQEQFFHLYSNANPCSMQNMSNQCTDGQHY